MKCPKCKKGKLFWLPPPPESTDQERMGACDNPDCDYMGDGYFNEGESFSSPEYKLKERHAK